MIEEIYWEVPVMGESGKQYLFQVFMAALLNPADILETEIYCLM